MATTPKNELKVSITDVTEKRFPGPSGNDVITLVVKFSIGPFGPYTIQVDSENTTKDDIVRLVAERANTIREIILLTE